MSDEAIGSLNNKFLEASFLALKHTFDKQWLEGNAKRLIVTAQNEDSTLQMALVFYLFSRVKLPENVLNSLPEPIKSEVLNTFDVYFEKGIEKGGVEGMEQGMEKGKIEEVRSLIVKLGFTNEQAAEIAEVSIDFVQKVHSSLK